MDITLERILSLLPKKEDGSFVRGAKKDFATSIGYDSGDIVSMWIKGNSTSYYGKLHEIAAKYNVSVEWLKGEDEKLNEKNIAIVEQIRFLAYTNETSLAQIEHDCGFPDGTIVKWATSQKSPPFDMLFKVAERFNTTLEELTGYEYEYLKSDSPETKKDTTLSGDVSELSKDVQELIAICKSNPALASALLAVAQQIQKGQAVQE